MEEIQLISDLGMLTRDELHGQKSRCTSLRCSLCVCVIGDVSVMKGNICPQLVVKTKYTHTLIKLSLYLLTYLLTNVLDGTIQESR